MSFANTLAAVKELSTSHQEPHRPDYSLLEEFFTRPHESCHSRLLSRKKYQDPLMDKIRADNRLVLILKYLPKTVWERQCMCNTVDEFVNGWPTEPGETEKAKTLLRQLAKLFSPESELGKRVSRLAEYLD